MAKPNGGTIQNSADVNSAWQIVSRTRRCTTAKRPHIAKLSMASTNKGNRKWQALTTEIMLQAIQKGVRAPLHSIHKPNSAKVRNCKQHPEINKTFGHTASEFSGDSIILILGPDFQQIEKRLRQGATSNRPAGSKRLSRHPKTQAT